MTNLSGWNIRPSYDVSKRRAELTFTQAVFVSAFAIACLILLWPLAVFVSGFAAVVGLIFAVIWLVCLPFRKRSTP